jgi:hypothetical protein
MTRSKRASLGLLASQRLGLAPAESYAGARMISGTAIVPLSR